MLAHRPILMSEAGMVVAGHHKAAEAGAAVLRAGGNAMDAAVAASATLCVAIPHMNGLGGDGIALYFEAATGRTTVVNGSGCAPASLGPDTVRSAGHQAMPVRGPFSVSVPGLVDAWESCLERFETRPLRELLAPAAALARRGVPVDVVLQAFLAGPIYAELAAEFPALPALYGSPGLHPLGTRLRNPRLADVIDAIAEAGASTFYRGAVAGLLTADLAAAGVPLSPDDLARHRTAFDAPLTVGFAGKRLHAAPPNAQGAALAALAALADMDARERSGPGALQPASFLRAKAAAFALRARCGASQQGAGIARAALAPDGLGQLAAEARLDARPCRSGGGDTSALVVVDAAGNAVSWVQSLFEEFGSGVASLSTGVVFHNRLALQSLDEADPFPLRAGERPFHTLCPALVEQDGSCALAIATPGDHGQPQAIHQVLLRLYGEGLHLQAAIEAPRLRHDSGPEVMVEDRIPLAWAEEIVSLGFTPRPVGAWSRLMGGVNAIERSRDGLLLGSADPRRASYAVTAG